MIENVIDIFTFTNFLIFFFLKHFRCSKQVSKYKCPRCFIGYCSLACYKSKEHEKCSENFFKENVMDEIKGMKASDQEKKKMMDILDQYNRYDENEEEDDDETEEEENG